MNRPFYIKNYCHIKEGTIRLDGSILFGNGSSERVPSSKMNSVAGSKENGPSENPSPELTSFLKSAYQHFGIDYPKFFKMDRLSKLAFIAAEAIFGGERTSPEDQSTAIILSNRASSLDTDRKYQKSISDPHNFYPSPAVFVYTLPNICIGEISIRHRLRSENSFFIFDAFNATFLKDYAENLLDAGMAGEALCGWVDVDENSYEAFLYLVSPTGDLLHTEQRLTELYHTP